MKVSSQGESEGASAGESEGASAVGMRVRARVRVSSGSEYEGYSKHRGGRGVEA